MLVLATVLTSSAIFAAEEEAGDGSKWIGLTANKPYLHVIHSGKTVKVERIQDPNYELRGYFAKTSRQCPPFCLRPMEVDPRVKTVGEIEVFNFIEKQLRTDKGLLVDARTPSWHQKGTIPGSVNYPFTTLSKGIDDLEMEEALEEFGAVKREEVSAFTGWLEDQGFFNGDMKTREWDFSNCKELIIWCNGPACGQSPRAIKGLLDVGYPPQKLFYYRGGMQMWQLFSLTTANPG
ncbi:MAG: rhodanese-like domain-containing protein [Gammaproteobacteria bacterium]|nr:rhodanese-like domain-containing protein [Gammaproteobacteria bacterium]